MRTTSLTIDVIDSASSSCCDQGCRGMTWACRNREDFGVFVARCDAVVNGFEWDLSKQTAFWPIDDKIRTLHRV